MLERIDSREISGTRPRFTAFRSTYTFPLTFFLQNGCISCPYHHRDAIRSVPKGKYSVVVGRTETIDNLEDVGIDRRIILK